MSGVEVRSKSIVLIAAVARNGVIGSSGDIPWHVPEDFAHFKASTMGQTILMGRATFDSIGRPLPGRDTIVLTRDRSWKHQGVRVAHTLQSAIDIAEELRGQVMVAGGSHLYAAALSVAHMQVISQIPAEPQGDAFYPHWDKEDWLLAGRSDRSTFAVESWIRKPVGEVERPFYLDDVSADAWWEGTWAPRLAAAVERQRKRSGSPSVNWSAIHQAALRVIVEAAEDRAANGPGATTGSRRLVRLSEHLSLQDLKEVQGALFHWSEFVRPRSTAS